MKGNSFILAVTLILFTSCGGNLFQSQSAPSSNSQAGLLASCVTPTQALEVSQELNIKFRVISEKRNLVEFFGVSEQVLLPYLQNSKITQNKVYENVVPTSDFQIQSFNTAFSFAQSSVRRNSQTTRNFHHINMLNALNVPGSMTGAGVKVAIIDTGVDYNHAHLNENIMLNSSDPHGQQADSLDQDNNGYRDDYVGFDFVNFDPYPMDDNGHGTHVAGLVAGKLSGIAPDAKILPIKAIAANGTTDIGTLTSAIFYAIDRGVDIINMSLGGEHTGQITSELQGFFSSVQVAAQNDILVIAAAGNGGSDGLGDCNDEVAVYPANIPASNVISVAAVGGDFQLTKYSNFGGNTVDIAAPGGDTTTGALSSTSLTFCSFNCSDRDARYEAKMGTSMSSPIVAGLTALIKQANPNLSHTQIKNILLEKSRYVPELEGKIVSSGVIDIQASVQEALSL